VIHPDVQARFLVRSYSLLLSAGVPRIYWILLRDYNGLTWACSTTTRSTRPSPRTPP